MYKVYTICCTYKAEHKYQCTLTQTFRAHNCCNTFIQVAIIIHVHVGIFAYELTFRGLSH